MTTPIFPSLPGQGIKVRKKPKMDLQSVSHANGRETRTSRYITPIWEFDLTFDGLGIGSTRPNLGNSSVETLAGFYAQTQGPLIPFFYVDPTDSVANGKQIGVGDGSTTTFILTHTIGGWSLPIDAIMGVTRVYHNGNAYTGAEWYVSGWNSITFYPGYTPYAGLVITADYTYAYYVRFSDDTLDFEEFMSMLMLCKTVKFQTVRQAAASWSGQLVTVILTTTGSWLVPAGVSYLNLLQCYGGGAGGQYGPTTGWNGAQGGAGGGGGGWGYHDGISVSPGTVLTIITGANGVGGTVSTPGNDDSLRGGRSSISIGGSTYVWGDGGGTSSGDTFSGGYGGQSPGGTGGDIDWRTGGVLGGMGGGGAGGPGSSGGTGGLPWEGGSNGSWPYPYSGGTVYGGSGGASGSGGTGAGTMASAGNGGGTGASNGLGGGAGGTGGSYPSGNAVTGGPGTITTGVDGRYYGPGGGGGGGASGRPGADGGAMGGGGGGGGVGANGGNGGKGGVLITYPYVYA